MASKTYANGRGIAHKKSNGMSIAFPDVCKTPTPGGPIPIPYPNIGKSSDTDKGPKKVKVDGAMPMTKGAKYKNPVAMSPAPPGASSAAPTAASASSCSIPST